MLYHNNHHQVHRKSGLEDYKEVHDEQMELILYLPTKDLTMEVVKTFHSDVRVLLLLMFQYSMKKSVHFFSIFITTAHP